LKDLGQGKLGKTGEEGNFFFFLAIVSRSGIFIPNGKTRLFFYKKKKKEKKRERAL
jgi:hypothetical protein